MTKRYDTATTPHQRAIAWPGMRKRPSIQMNAEFKRIKPAAASRQILALSAELRTRGAALQVLNLGGGNVDTGTPMGGMVFTVMAALAEMELAIKRERITDSVNKRRAAGKDLGGRRARFTDSQIQNARRLINAGESETQVAKDLSMSRATLYRRMSELDA